MREINKINKILEAFNPKAVARIMGYVGAIQEERGDKPLVLTPKAPDLFESNDGT